VALLLSLCDERFLAVEATEESAEELCKDINFFRTALGKKHVFSLPEANGPALSGQRAGIIHFLGEEDSLIVSFKNLDSAVWTKKDILDNVLTLRKGMESGREEIEKKLNGMGYKGVSLVSERGEFSRRGWLLDIFPSTAERPMRLEFFGDEIDSIRHFDIDTQRSAEDVLEFLVLPAADPVSGTTPAVLMKGARYFFSDSIQDGERLPGGIFFSRYSIKGTGCDPGLLPLKGLGIMPEERSGVAELPGKIRDLMVENRVMIVSSSKGQSQRLKDILRD